MTEATVNDPIAASQMRHMPGSDQGPSTSLARTCSPETSLSGFVGAATSDQGAVSPRAPSPMGAVDLLKEGMSDSLEALLNDDLFRVSSALSESADGVLVVHLRTDSDSVEAEFDTSSRLYDAVREELALAESDPLTIAMGGTVIEDEGLTIGELGIEPHSKLSVHFSAVYEWEDPVGEPYPGPDKIEARLGAVAESMDTNNDGIVDCEELIVALERMYATSLPEPVKEQMREEEETRAGQTGSFSNLCNSANSPMK